MEVEQQPTGVPDGWEIVAAKAAPPAEPPLPGGRAEIRRPIASGRGTQFDPTLPNRAVDAATTPLGHPTGIEPIDAMTSPAALASLALGGASIVRAGVTGGVTAGAKAALANATPMVKYEATKLLLTKMGVPAPMATVAAMAVSGLQKKGAGGAAAEAAPAEAVAPTAASTPVARPPAQFEQAIAKAKAAVATSPAEMPVAGGTPPLPGPPPPEVAAVPRPTGTVVPGRSTGPSILPEGTAVPPATPEYYPQKFLNEVAIQARRQGVTLGDADYAVAKGMVEQGASPADAVKTIAAAHTTPGQVPTSAPAAPPATVPVAGARPRMDSEAANRYFALRKGGMPEKQAMEAALAEQTMRQKFGLPSSRAVADAVKSRNETGTWQRPE